MSCDTTVDVEELMAEIAAYLDAVDFFRREGCEPRWRSDWRDRGYVDRAS